MCPASLSFEDAPSREPMKSTRGGEKKRGEFLLRLRRLLLAGRDRPWVDVHREISDTLCPTSADRRLLQGRLPLLVALDVADVGGELVRADTQQPLARSAPSTRLYVCPTSGLLRRINLDDARDRVRLSEWELLRRLGKRWYLLALAPLPAEGERSMCLDAVLREAVNAPSPRLRDKLTRLYGRPGVYARGKRQLGRAEAEQLREEQAARRAG